MKTIKIYCKECGSELINVLTEFPKADLCWEGEQDIMPKNNFSILTHLNEKFIVVAIDEYNLKNHLDESRFNGFSGSNGTNGLNKLCLNGHEVATEFSDYWTGDYIRFVIDNIVIKEKIDEFTFKGLRL